MLIKEDVKIGEGGEVISADIVTLKKVTAEQFCQVYLRDNDEFYKLSKAESNVLSICMYLSVYYDDPDLDKPGNKISVGSQFLDDVKKKTGLADSTIKNAIASLVKKEMIIKDEKYRGVYYLNPKHFFKGRITDRTKLVTKTIKYEIVSRT